MSSNRMRHVRWLAPVALVGALGVAACGSDGDDAADARTGGIAAAAVGSDQHLENLAAEASGAATAAVGSDQHLVNLAEEGAAAGDANGSDRHLENLATDSGINVFEAGNRAAAEANEADDTDGEFVPGSRRMPLR